VSIMPPDPDSKLAPSFLDQVRSHTDTSRADECWRWGGRLDRDGYGRAIGNRLAHRLAWGAARGPIPEGLHIDHLCRTRSCINPAHMEPVPPAVNTLRGVSFSAINARKTVCNRGHLFTEEDTRIYRGYRVCKRCDVIRQAEYQKRRRAV
jgi:hypothetical protein